MLAKLNEKREHMGKHGDTGMLYSFSLNHDKTGFFEDFEVLFLHILRLTNLISV